MLLSADDGVVGNELWLTDGTAGGTTLIRDIKQSTHDARLSDLTELDGRLYFVANEGVGGSNVWEVAASDQPAIRLDQPEPLDLTVPLDEVVTVHGRTYFAASTLEHGSELWALDSETDIPWLVGEVHLGSESANPRMMQLIGDAIYFVADDSLGSDLWKLDPITDDIVRISHTHSVVDYSVYLDRFVFVDRRSSQVDDLWILDPESGETELLRTYSPGMGNKQLQFKQASGQLFFVQNDQEFGDELWVTNGRVDGTRLVKDIHPFQGASIESLTESNGIVYFGASEPKYGLELWRSDGTSEGTYGVFDLAPGPRSGYSGPITEFQGMLYFGGGNRESALWRTDGTLESIETVFVFDQSRSTVTYLNGVGDKLFYSESGVLRFLDSPTGSIQVVDLEDSVNVPNAVTMVGDDIYLLSKSSPLGSHGSEVLRIDLENQFSLLADMLPGPTGNAKNLHWTGTELLVSYGDELFRSDLTDMGTRRVERRFAGSITHIDVLGTKLLVVGEDRRTGNELRLLDPLDRSVVTVRDLYRGIGGVVGVDLGFTVHDRRYFGYWNLGVTDGTFFGTKMISTSILGIENQDREFHSFAALGEKLFAIAELGNNSQELWSYDPVSSTFQLVKVLNSTGASAEIFMLELNNQLVISVSEELWVSDGSSDGTHRYFSLEQFDSPRQFARVGDQIVFGLGPNRSGLWTTDGTVGGTKLVPFAQPLSRIDDMYATDDGVFFMATTENWGRELFHYDGASIQLVADVNPGPGDSDLLELVSSNGVVWASINDGTHGAELWQFDLQQGTAALVEDLIPGPVGSNPAQLTLVGTDTVYFAADSVPYGVELFRFQSGGSHAPGDFNRDAVLDVADVDLLYAAVRNGTNELNFDLNQDEVVNQHDVDYWVRQLFGSNYGDANLDGIFDSSDLVQVFQRGEYEDGIDGNSNWSDGDWNADGEFSTADLVLAFQADAYVTTAVPNVIGKMILDPNDQRWAKRPRSAWLA
ncbi:MAG: hypothetical protein R3C28_27180 [Pirellulaceae bacterium]